jgi:hypothetical protein
MSDQLAQARALLASHLGQLQQQQQQQQQQQELGLTACWVVAWNACTLDFIS